MSRSKSEQSYGNQRKMRSRVKTCKRRRDRHSNKVIDENSSTQDLAPQRSNNTPFIK